MARIHETPSGKAARQEDGVAMGFLRGVAWFSTCALATVGALTFVPDSAWESFPEAFAPLRAQLAGIGVAPAKYGDFAPRAQLVPATTDPNELVYEPNSAEPSKSDSWFDSDSERPRVRIGGRERANDEPEQRAPVVAPSESKFNGIATHEQEAPRERDFPAPTGVPQEPSAREFEVYDRNFAETDANQAPPIDSAPNFPAGTDADLFAPAPQATTPEPLQPLPTAQQDSVLAPVNPAFANPAPEPGRELLHENMNERQPDVQNVAPQSIANGGANTLESPAPVEEPAPPANPALQPLQPLAAPTDRDAGSFAPPAQSPAQTATPQVADAPQPNPAQPEAQTPPQSPLPPPAQPLANSNLTTGTTSYETAPITNAAPNAATGVNCAPPSSGASSLASPSADAELNAALASAQNIESAEQLRDVFFTLNRLRASYEASGAVEQTNRINAALDQLAFHVFYDPHRAILEPFHQVQQGETLESLARQCQVAPDTLAAINGLAIAYNAPLQPGSTLKLVRGPVTAELSKSKKEMLLKFNNLYAGRFKFGVPQQGHNISGEYVVESKMENPACDAVDINGAKMTIPGGSQDNPLGICWIGLNGGCGLQGTNRPELVGTDVPENGGFVFSNREISQLNVLLPIGASLYFRD